MKTLKITALAAIVIVTGIVTHHIYERHLSSGYASILKAAMTGPYDEERVQYIHEARAAVRTDKDREVEVKLDRWKQNFDTQYDVPDEKAAYDEREQLWVELCTIAGVSPYPMPG